MMGPGGPGSRSAPNTPHGMMPPHQHPGGPHGPPPPGMGGPHGPHGHPGGPPPGMMGPGGPNYGPPHGPPPGMGGPMGHGPPPPGMGGGPPGNPNGPKPMPIMSGKVYPADQPMVFNSANPNAPPIHPCGVCHKEVHDNDQAILCESGCNFWFHRYCSGLTEIAWKMITEEVFAEWVCDKCLNSKQIPLVKFKP